MAGGKFVKGQSGNPKGRPAVVKEIRELAQQHGTKAVEVLASLMNDVAQDGRVRIAAARELLDRGYGKASQHIEVTPTEGQFPIKFVDAPAQESMEEWIRRRAADGVG